MFHCNHLDGLGPDQVARTIREKKNPNLAIAEAQQLGAGVAEAFQRPKSAAEARGPVWGYGRPDV